MFIIYNISSWWPLFLGDIEKNHVFTLSKLLNGLILQKQKEKVFNACATELMFVFVVDIRKEIRTSC